MLWPLPSATTRPCPDFCAVRIVLGPLLAFWVSFVAVDAFLPSGAIANQVPFTPWPLVSPAAWSPEKRYSGQPAIVSCFVPSGRVTVPTTDLSTPSAYTLPPGWMISGGHVVWQPPVHVVVGGCGESLSNRYSVRPSWSTTILPSGE